MTDEVEIHEEIVALAIDVGEETTEVVSRFDVTLETDGSVRGKQSPQMRRCLGTKTLDRATRVDGFGRIDAQESDGFFHSRRKSHNDGVAVDDRRHYGRCRVLRFLWWAGAPDECTETGGNKKKAGRLRVLHVPTFAGCARRIEQRAEGQDTEGGRARIVCGRWSVNEG